METIDTTMANLEILMGFVKKLEEHDVGLDEIARLKDDPTRLREVAKILKSRPWIPKRLNKKASQELIRELKLGEIDDEGHVAINGHFPLYDDERRWLREPEQIQQLLKELTESELQVVIRRGGLTGKPSYSVQDTAKYLELKPHQVNHLRGCASRKMRMRTIELVKEWREVAIRNM